MSIQVRETSKKRGRGCLWGCLICLAVYIAISALIGYAFSSLFSDSSEQLEEHTVYRLQMRGVLVEQNDANDPFVQFSSLLNETDDQVGLNELIDNIRFAAEDDRIEGILLEGGTLQMGQASAKQLRDELIRFKQSGKWIIAYAQHYDQTNYYVASVADKVCLNPSGSLNWNGLTAQKRYYTNLLEKIGVKVHILKVGTFKSAVEPYFRTDMSDADKRQTRRFLQEIWREQRVAVGQQRHINADTLDDYADLYLGLQSAQTVQDLGLVDTLVYRQSVDSLIYNMFGHKYRTITTSGLLSVERVERSANNTIAVVYADGAIVDSGKDGISGSRYVGMLNKISNDKRVKAVVLRVNSPGGSADASEQIWHAVQVLKEKGKPVVVSMGDYAASGGYYISCGADYIYAEPNTLTGSIGIFGLIPNLKGLSDKIGLDYDGVSTNDHSALTTNLTLGEASPEEIAMMQSMVERGYELFINRVAQGRGMSVEQVKHIAEGHVWVGSDAMQFGLVDAMGGIQEAIDKAAELAGIEPDDYRCQSYPETTDWLDRLLEAFDTSTPEERMMRTVRTLIAEPRVMMQMEDIIIK